MLRNEFKLGSILRYHLGRTNVPKCGKRVDEVVEVYMCGFCVLGDVVQLYRMLSV